MVRPVGLASKHGWWFCCDHPALTVAQEEDLREQHHEIHMMHHEVIQLILLNGVDALNVPAVLRTIVGDA